MNSRIRQSGHLLALALAAILLAGEAQIADAQTVVDQEASDFVIRQTLEAFMQTSSGQFGAAEKLLSDLIETEEFSRVSDSLQRHVYIQLNRAVRQRAGVQAAYKTAVTITEFESVQPGDWITRLDLAPDTEDVIYSLTKLADGWPESLDGVRTAYILNVLASARTNLDETTPYFTLIEALADADWSDPDYNAGIDREWYWATMHMLAAEELELARKIATRIRYVPTLIAIQADRRFDALAASESDFFVIEGAIDREVEARRKAVADYPDKLSIATDLAFALRRGNRLQEAVGAFNEFEQPRNSGIQNRTGWIDEETAYPWFFNERADLLWQIGMHEAAAQQLQEARTVFAPEGSMHISQSINLGRYLARSGLADAARDAVEDLEGLTAYGDMYVRYVQLMAAIVDEDEREIGKILESMRRRSEDAQTLYQRALIISGHLDDAADLLIERLKDARSRTGALVEVQTYLDDVVTETAAPLDLHYAEQKRRLLSRPDVREAIDAVGRVESFPVWFSAFEV